MRDNIMDGVQIALKHFLNDTFKIIYKCSNPIMNLF